MKALLLILLTGLLSMNVMAQKPPLSATLTKPGSQTFKFDPKQKIPPIILPCLLTNGKPRPYDCEFTFDRLEFIGNDGAVLGTVKPVKGQPKPTPLLFSKAKKAPPVGQTGLITYTAKAYFTRRHKPAFLVNKGYQIRSCKVTACLQSDEITTVMAGIKMPAGIGDQAVVTIDLSWLYSKKDSQLIGPHELYIENDVTTTKFPFSSGVTMRDKSEAWIDIQPTITGDPTPVN
jgi:hypothetical protein